MKKSVLLLLLCLASLCCGQDVEFCSYKNASLKLTLLPVFPASPLKSGEKCYPVFDVLIDGEGFPVGTAKVYSPGGPFNDAYMGILEQRTYNPAMDCDTGVPSMLRDVVASYFYVSESDKPLTQLPVCLLPVDDKVYNICFQNNYKPMNLTLEVDEAGRLKESGIDKDPIAKALFHDCIGQQIFIPGYAGDEPVACELTLHLGDTHTFPEKVVDLLCTEKMDEFSVGNVAFDGTISFKMTYDMSGALRAVRCSGDQDVPDDLTYLLLQQVRLGRSEVLQSDGQIDEQLVLQVLPEQGRAIITRREQCSRVLPKAYRIEEPKVKRFNVGDQVLVAFTLGVDGMPCDFSVISTTNEKLVAPTLAAIKHWRYEPALYNGTPTYCRMIQLIRFN